MEDPSKHKPSLLERLSAMLLREPEDREELITLLRDYSPQQIAELMDLSDPLAGLNVARYQAWAPEFTTANAKQAVLAFNGDVYEGLDAKSLGEAELGWLQDHVCILSGLYGVLRPLDWMQPYRLEMGTALKTDKGSNLYKFWGPQIAQYLNDRLAKDKNPVIINLASQEYFKSVDRKALQARVVECVFEDYKGGKYKVISFNAKASKEDQQKHNDFVTRMVERGYTDKQVRLLSEWYLRVRKSQ